MYKNFKQILSPTMMDPSLLIHRKFWLSLDRLLDILPSQSVYAPSSIMYAGDDELSRFFGRMVRPEYKLTVKEVRKKASESLQLFSWKNQTQNIRKIFAKEFDKLRFNLERSRLPFSVRDILLDEFVFLASSSSILSRLKKSFTLLKQFKIPLIDLREIAPDDWKPRINRVKKAVRIINYIATLQPFRIELAIAGKVISGVSIFIVDP